MFAQGEYSRLNTKTCSIGKALDSSHLHRNARTTSAHQQRASQDLIRQQFETIINHSTPEPGWLFLILKKRTNEVNVLVVNTRGF